jgi:hypothetical protein
MRRIRAGFSCDEELISTEMSCRALRGNRADSLVGWIFQALVWQSDIEIDMLNIRLIVKLGPYPAGEFRFDVNGEGDLHTIIEKGEFERAYNYRLLIEDLNEAHEDPWS